MSISALNLELLQGYVTRLVCKIPSGLHPSYSRVSTSTVNWAQSQGLLVDESLQARLVRTDPALLGALVYRDGYSEEALQLATDYMTWLNLHDDLWIDGERRDPDQLDADHARTLALFRGATPEKRAHRLVHALAELRHRLLGFSRDVTEFDQRVEQYLTAKSWECRNHLSGTVSDVQTYARFRAYGGAVLSCFETGILTRPIAMTARLRRHAYLGVLSNVANNLVCWSNDIVSLRRELEEGCTTNLVMVLRHQHTLSWPEALERAVAMWNIEMANFEILTRQLLVLPGFNRNERSSLSALVGLYGSWIRGNLDHCLSPFVGRWSAAVER